MPSHPKHLFFAKSRDASDAFESKVWNELVPALKELRCESLGLALTDVPKPRFTILPLRPENLVMVSASGAIDVSSYASAMRLVSDAPFGYRVEESHPIRYRRDWPDGVRSPGAVLLTLLAKNERLSYDAFMHEWHGRHTPKAMRIHPMWSYGRNVVEASVVDGSPAFEGVVEEHYRELRDIVNPLRMFGGPLRAIPHMVEVGLHANHFLDLRRTENYLLSEFHLATSPA